MVNMHNHPLPEDLFFYISAPHRCSYLDGQESTTLLVDPKYPITPDLYTKLSSLGFRRSGSLIYIPRCLRCQACRPIRIKVDDFKPNRSQKRNLKKNSQIITRTVEAKVVDEHFELFRKYINNRHEAGSMDVDSIEQYAEFFFTNRVKSELVEFYFEEELVAVSVIDPQLDGLSAVYTFFNPDKPELAMGVYVILWQIEECKIRKLPHLYLGYQIDECQKMAYKANYKPYQLLIDGSWQSFD